MARVIETTVALTLLWPIDCIRLLIQSDYLVSECLCAPNPILDNREKTVDRFNRNVRLRYLCRNDLYTSRITCRLPRIANCWRKLSMYLVYFILFILPLEILPM